MGVSAFEDEVLNRCADDYEAPQTIAADIARDLGRPVTEAEVLAAFVALAEKGLVQAYVFESSRGSYVPIEPKQAKAHAAWFFITSSGREVMNNGAS